MKSTPKSTPDKELVKVFEAAGLVEFVEYLQSGKRLMWLNFKAGVAKGFGVTFGMTVVLGIAIWILTMLVDLPIVGEYFGQAKQVITEYADSTNYEDEFAEMNEHLREINDNMKAEDSDPQDTGSQDTDSQDTGPKDTDPE
ncbi:DUF5665 domain-containing protein [Pseudomonadota bacterium]